LVIDTIKKAENQDGWIVRVYQNASKTEHVQLVFNGEFKKVQEVTIEEKVIKDMKHHNGQVDFSINAFEVKTFFFS
jgi:alpha-mannosidase